jgi:rhodanese-related sulfurtransferase
MTFEGKTPDTMAYAGDVTVLKAWEILKNTPESVLVDVRTNAEWAYVGVPDLSSLNKKVATVSWIEFPSMTPNPHFLEAVKDCQPDPHAPTLFLCRSGVRSIAAAIAATNAGFTACYNILAGFEGDMDSHRHRGTISGWKFENLDWIQN